MKYIVKGDVIGTISKHNKLSAAIKSMRRDKKVCRNLPGEKSYSDVKILRVDGEPLSEKEQEEICGIND